MDEKQLDDLLKDAQRSYNRPPAAPLDSIWDGVSEQAFAPSAVSRTPLFRMIGIAAAALLVGAIGGRMSVGGARSLFPEAVAVRPVQSPNDQATERLLGQTAVLLAALPSERDTAVVDPTIAADGARLLGTTRSLLDSPVADNARIRNLLLDLELVLAQVARLQHQRAHDELLFIQSAMNERDIMPRMQSAVSDLSAGSH